MIVGKNFKCPGRRLKYQSADFLADFFSGVDDALSVEAFSGLSFEASAFVFDLATRTDNSNVVREVGKVGSALSSALFMSKDLVSRDIISKEHFMNILFRKTTALFQATKT